MHARADQPAGDLVGTAQVKNELRAFVIVNALGFAALALLSAWLLAGVNPRRPWDAAAFAASPALVLTGLINWDMLAVVMVAGALWTWARGRPVATGVLIGLGTATKLYPLFLLGPIAIICLRERRYRDLVDTVLAARRVVVRAERAGVPQRQGRVEGVLGVQLRARPRPRVGLAGAQPGTGDTISATTVNHWSWALFAPLVRGGGGARLPAPSTPRLAQLAFLVVAGFLLVNKVYSPQYVLWLLPLAVLARPRWRDQLVWQACEVVYFASVWWYLDGDLQPGGGEDVGFYWLAIMVRMLGELYLVRACVVARRACGPGAATRCARPTLSQCRATAGAQVMTSTRSNAVAV